MRPPRGTFQRDGVSSLTPAKHEREPRPTTRTATRGPGYGFRALDDRRTTELHWFLSSTGCDCRRIGLIVVGGKWVVLEGRSDPAAQCPEARVRSPARCAFSATKPQCRRTHAAASSGSDPCLTAPELAAGGWASVIQTARAVKAELDTS